MAIEWPAFGAHQVKPVPAHLFGHKVEPAAKFSGTRHGPIVGDPVAEQRGIGRLPTQGVADKPVADRMDFERSGKERSGKSRLGEPRIMSRSGPRADIADRRDAGAMEHGQEPLDRVFGVTDSEKIKARQRRQTFCPPRRSAIVQPCRRPLQKPASSQFVKPPALRQRPQQQGVRTIGLPCPPVRVGRALHIPPAGIVGRAHRAGDLQIAEKFWLATDDRVRIEIKREHPTEQGHWSVGRLWHTVKLDVHRILLPIA